MNRRKFLLERSVIAGGLALGGCGVAINEDTSLYFGGAEDSPGMVEHEMCHQEQMKRLPGGSREFWKRYLTDKEWACQQEVECGYTKEEHFIC